MKSPALRLKELASDLLLRYGRGELVPSRLVSIRIEAMFPALNKEDREAYTEWVLDLLEEDEE